MGKWGSVLLLIGAVLFFTSCQRQREARDVPVRNAFEAERDAFFNYLQKPNGLTPGSVSNLAAFNSKLLNEPSRFTLYIGNDVKASANMGIYIADLNYCILYKQGKTGGDFFRSAHELSRAIGLEKNTLEFLMKRYAENLERQDSIKKIVDDLFAKSTLRLRGTEREKLAGVAMAAYQVENIYLALATLQATPTNLTADQEKAYMELRSLITGQGANLEIIHAFIKANSDPLDPHKNPNYPFFDYALRDLIDVYRNFEPPHQSGAHESDANLNTLREKVNLIRSKIVSEQS